MSVSYTEYFKEIEALAQATQKAIDEGQDQYEAIIDHVDGHSYTIYTGKSLDVLRHSPNDDAHYNEFGLEGIIDAVSGSLAGLYSTMAYFAMIEDVRDLLNG